ncbi:MAG TPA: NfeD family protein [Casimicrobiaceae bacterium]|jgi:membrane protein implicated in regulation of membrane protease activity|nr:NfeD family protein [Casimicrobiaceae bacterium]
MTESWAWWIAAAVLIGAELLTGTFYLLAVGLAVAIGGATAWAGYPLTAQFTVAGVAGVVLTVVAHQWRRRQAPPPPQQALDVGQSVHVDGWNPDGTARVTYRGTHWTAELATPSTPRAKTMYIVATRGSVLVVADRRV